MRKIALLSGLLLALGTSAARAGFIETYSGSVKYTSDAEGDKVISLPSFDTQGGVRSLMSVTVDVTHSGSVSERADNDDPLKPADVSARMIRQFRLTGPGVNAIDNQTINSPIVHLTQDNGDNGAFDDTPPDGVNFGLLQYNNALAGTFNPANGLYATPGPGLVNFTVLGFGTPGSFLLMINDLQFFGIPPDQWQLEVENPTLRITTKVTYEWTPEPATLALLGLGALALRRFRR